MFGFWKRGDKVVRALENICTLLNQICWAMEAQEHKTRSMARSLTNISIEMLVISGTLKRIEEYLSTAHNHEAQLREILEQYRKNNDDVEAALSGRSTAARAATHTTENTTMNLNELFAQLLVQAQRDTTITASVVTILQGLPPATTVAEALALITANNDATEAALAPFVAPPTP